MNFKLLNPDEIRQYCDYFSQSGTLAIDTEFCRTNSYWPKLALIQLSDGQETVLIDPLEEGVNLEPVRNLLAQKDIVKIFHSCRQDLEILLKVFGEIPENIFDTQLAYNFLYPTEEISLARMLEEQLKVNLNKSKQNTNWIRRPLSVAQLTYAANDVIYLPEMHQKLLTSLESCGRYEWLREEQLNNFAAHKLAPTTDYWLRLAKRGNHRSRQLYILKKICDWREKVAQELNYNRKRVCADETILKIVETKSLDPSIMQEIPLTHRNNFDGLWEEIIAATEEEWPARLKRKPLNIKEQELLEQLRTLLDNVASNLNVSPKLIATTEELKSYVRGNGEVPLLKGWRYEVFGRLAENLS
ncbi:ribonuclease D [Candidatus Odyssella thessalonicensis]|uniref:ribonuclease D n=1 Tax=Candidatus Odyssella thessalonicensis TaxID=84647 RepID=UPI000225B6D4|nr:ribonuclease D [Candidatus Odyssella thessalonicensis]